MKDLLLGQVGELFAKALEIAECVLVNDADETEQFQQRILERRRRQQQLVPLFQRRLESIGNDVGRFVDVAQPMRFVNDDQVPRGSGDIRRLGASEVVGADDDGVFDFKRTKISLLDCLVIGLRLQYPARQKELLSQLLVPLLAEIRRRDDEDAPLPLGPSLGKNKPRFNGLAETDLVR